MQDQPAPQACEIDWNGDLPVSRRFGDSYYARGGGPGEVRHVFLGGNDLPSRFRPGFAIAETGFGTGLNMLVARAAWVEAGVPGRLRYTSFEAYPMAPADIARALGAFPAIAATAAGFLGAYAAGARRWEDEAIALEIVPGDARRSVPRWQGRADAWFLDGFAPARNPAMWEPALLEAVAGHTASGGTAATYTAAGAVRRALADAGFEVTRVAGFGAKRHMTRARRP